MCLVLLYGTSPGAPAHQSCLRREKEYRTKSAMDMGMGKYFRLWEQLEKRYLGDSLRSTKPRPYLCSKPERDTEIPGSSLLAHANRTTAL